MLQKGDKVKFLDEVGGGVISKVIDLHRVMLLSDDGFEVPVRVQDLVLYEKGVKPKMLTNEGGDDEEVITDRTLHVNQNIKEDFDRDGVVSEDSSEAAFSGEVYLALVESDKKREASPVFDLYLINDSQNHLYYVLTQQTDDSMHRLLGAGALDPGMKMAVDSCICDPLAEPFQFMIQAIRFRQSFFVPTVPIQSVLSVAHADLLSGDGFVSNDFFDQKASLFPLSVDLQQDIERSFQRSEMQRILQEKITPDKRPSMKKIRKSGLREVDLHIHELIEDETGLSAEDMLKLQMDCFHKQMQEALRKQEKKIIFIHGKGNGRLRYEIQQTVSRLYPNASCQDASFQEYGFGATLVIIHSFGS